MCARAYRPMHAHQHIMAFIHDGDIDCKSIRTSGDAFPDVIHRLKVVFIQESEQHTNLRHAHGIKLNILHALQLDLVN